jgi:PIN domain nuclease of toxin-antitoxin system
MDLILDTCAFIYLCKQPSKLSAQAKLHVLNRQNRRFLSIASIWEMAIKSSLPPERSGSLNLGTPLDVFIPAHMDHYGLELLPIELEHTYKVETFKQDLGDPWDRIIIAQGLIRSIPIVTSDRKWGPFGVEVIW